MNVYQTRRTACLPQEVYDAVKAQAGKIELQGFGIANRGNSTTPFPIPRTAWRRSGTTRCATWAAASIATTTASRSARTATSTRSASTSTASSTRTWTRRRTTCLLGFLSYFTAPATLEGTVFLVHEPVDQVKQSRSAWIYNAGQRRVRRAPDLAYDNVNDARKACARRTTSTRSMARRTATTGSSSARRKSTSPTTRTSSPTRS